MFANPRFMCNPGLGFKAPAEARVGNYIDKKCPFTGKVLTIRCLLVVVVSCVVLMAMHFEGADCDFNSDLFLLQVSIRGRILTGVVAKLKMNRTAVIRRDYLHYVKKYNRYNY